MGSTVDDVIEIMGRIASADLTAGRPRPAASGGRAVPRAADAGGLAGRRCGRRYSPGNMSESAAHRRIQHEIDRTRFELVTDLNTIAADVAAAIAAVRGGRPFNAHIIANAAMVTAAIARWNLAQELLPLVEEG